VLRPAPSSSPTSGAKRWDFSRGVWLLGFWCYTYWDSTLKAACYNPSNGELRFAAKDEFGIGSPRKWDKNKQYPFYALHVFEELDSPGEYYLDRRNNRLFFWRRRRDENARPPDPCAKPLLQANGVTNLVVAI
jgi:hypothetical protein